MLFNTKSSFNINGRNNNSRKKYFNNLKYKTIKHIVFFSFCFLIITMQISCKSAGRQKTNKADWGFDNYLLEVQKNTSRQRYSSAINNLNEMQAKFPNQETVMVNYLIGFNYFSIKAYSSARKYFDNVFTIYDTFTNEGEKIENEKFIILARTLIQTIDENEAYFDPYHVREEINNSKKNIKPKKE